MTNRIALALAVLLLALLALDLVLGGGGTMFAARRFLALLDWLAFWR